MSGWCAICLREDVDTKILKFEETTWEFQIQLCDNCKEEYFEDICKEIYKILDKYRESEK